MKAVACTLLGACEYTVGTRLSVPRRVLVAHTVKRIRQGGVLAIKLAQALANRKSLLDDDELAATLSGMQCVTTYDGDGRARHEASIAVVMELGDGTAVKTLRDASVLGDLADIRRVERALRALRAPPAIYETLAALVEEIDMTTERSKYRAYAHSLRGCGNVVVPEVHASTSTRVVMTYVPSVLVKDLSAPVDIRDVNAFFSGIIVSAFTTGTFHLDLHAGNVGYVGDERKFVVYDMGSVSDVPPARMHRLRQVLVRATECAFFDDWDRVAGELLDGDVMVTIRDPGEMRRLMTTMVAYARGDVGLAAVVDGFRVVGGGVVAETTVSRMLQSVALLEGTCKMMNPDFVPYNALTPRDVLRARWG
jgi:predicted unusual protein kinase regulating ubiquinone biosynthesis (AarF/ABC1/UbiB family)